MNITICGSIAFISEMNDCKTQLEAKGHTVLIPSFTAHDKDGSPIDQQEFYTLRKSGAMDLGWFEKEKSRAIQEHFTKIEAADAILVTNYSKNNIEGYIGGNTLIEIGLAFYLKKNIYFLNPIPEIGYKEELIGMKPVIVHGDMDMLI